METNPVPAEGQKNNRNIIIYAVVGVLLCCCCVATAVGGYYAYQAYVAAQQAVEDIQNFDIPTDVPFVPVDPNGTPGIMSECTSPTVEGTTISVIQQPDASGVWREEWNVNCGDGTFKAFPLTFTPENGIVNVTVDFGP